MMSANPMQTRFGCYIGNIDRSVTVDMLKQVFCQCGTILDCSLNGREGDPYRFGFIDFATEDDRSRALKYNGFTLVGRKLKVGVSKGNVNRGDHGAAGGNGMGGGAGRMGPRYGNGGGMGYNGMPAMDASGLAPQQLMEARLLLQFLQEGKMDPRQLSPAQQQLLIVCLGGASAAAGALAGGGGSSANSGSTTPTPAQPTPMMGDAAMFGHMGGAQGMYMNMGTPNMMNGMGGDAFGMMPHRPQQPQSQPQHQWGQGMSMPNNAGNAYASMMPGSAALPSPSPMSMQQPPLPSPQPQPSSAVGAAAGSAAAAQGTQNRNTPPSAETMRLREKQREQFFAVVRRETEKYERKTRNGGDRSGDSSASDDDDGDRKAAKKSKKESSK